MKYEHFGICTTKSTAFYNPTRKAPLPEDYVGDFAEPTNPQDCCVVLRRTEGKRGARTPPRRCGGRRRMWNPEAPERAALCCSSHSTREAEANAWRANQGDEQ
jgi:hypothetical protein